MRLVDPCFRLDAKVDEGQLRTILDQNEIEESEQSVFMASCVSLVKMLAEGNAEVTGLKLLGE